MGWQSLIPGTGLRWVIRILLAFATPAAAFVAGTASRVWQNDLNTAPFSEHSWIIYGLSSVAVLSSIITVLLSYVDKREEDKKREQIELRHSRAISLYVVRESRDVRSLLVSNLGSHLVTKIRVKAFSKSRDESRPYPTIIPTNSEIQPDYQCVGLWFSTPEFELTPNTGVSVASWSSGPAHMMGIDVDWIDHEGKQRRSSSNVENINARNLFEIPMNPLESQV